MGCWWNRTLGQLQNHIAALLCPHLHFFVPSLLFASTSVIAVRNQLFTWLSCDREGWHLWQERAEKLIIFLNLCSAPSPAFLTHTYPWYLYRKIISLTSIDIHIKLRIQVPSGNFSGLNMWFNTWAHFLGQRRDTPLVYHWEQHYVVVLFEIQ